LKETQLAYSHRQFQRFSAEMLSGSVISDAAFRFLVNVLQCTQACPRSKPTFCHINIKYWPLLVLINWWWWWWWWWF